MMRLLGFFVVSLIGYSTIAYGQVLVRIGNFSVPEGTSSITFPVELTGGAAFQDLVGLIEVEGGPTISSLATTGSVWETAAGGFSLFYGSQGPPAAIIDPQLSVESNADTLSATGRLFTVTLDLSASGPGEYPVKMSGTLGGDAKFLLNGLQTSAVLINGSVRIISDVEVWREEHFPLDFDDPFLLLTVWGNDADPDEDGIPNCLEYAFGTDPNATDPIPASASAPGKPWIEVVRETGEPVLNLYYCSRNVSGFSYDLQKALSVTGSYPTINGEFVELFPPADIAGTGYRFHQLRYTGTLQGMELFRVFVTKP